MAFDDTMLAIAMRGEYHDWSWASFVQAELPNRTIAGVAQLWSNFDRGVLSAFTTEDAEALAAMDGAPFTVRSRQDMSAQWQIEAVTTGERCATPLGLEIDILDLQILSAGQAAPYHRVVYREIKLPSYTNGLWLSESVTRSVHHGYTHVQVFGRELLLSELRNDEDAERRLIAVTLQGAWFTQAELDAVELVLYLLAGVGGIRQCVETYNSNAQWQSRSYHRLGHAVRPDARPLFPVEQYSDPAFYERVSSMIMRAHDLIIKGFPLRAILFHTFASQQPVPEIAITHLGIAIDGIQNAVVEKIKGEGKLMDPGVFEKRIQPVIEAARNEFSQTGDQENLELILRRILGSNDWSLRERWKRFWRDYIGYQLTDRERTVLDHRDAAVHDAYILRTEYDLAIDADPKLDRRPYEERLRELLVDANVFRNVVNRVILTLLGYKGAFVDFTEWGEVLWI